jgi:hypothetical protein
MSGSANLLRPWIAPQVPTGGYVKKRRYDWIWHIRGTVPLAPSHRRLGDTLTFHKENQAPQDKMSIFDEGVLRIQNDVSGPVLSYNLVSRALLYCFLAPLFFLAFAGLTIGLGIIDKPTPAEIALEKKKDEERERKIAARPQNPLDKFLGAPPPEKPKTEAEKKKEEAEKKAKGEEEPSEHSPTAAYVFAGIFAALYLAGRTLEAWLIKRLFRRRLLGL